MRMRQVGLAALLAGQMIASPVIARELSDKIALQLRQQGFSEVIVEGTWLGRERITAKRDGGSREIVVNPTTGEILRDLWLNDRGMVRAPDIDFDDDDLDDIDDDDVNDGTPAGGTGGQGGGGGGGGGGNSGSGGGDDSGDDGDGD